MVLGVARRQLRTVLICVVNDIEFLAKILLVDSVLLYEVCNDTVREQKTQRRRKNSTTYAVLPGDVCMRGRKRERKKEGEKQMENGMLNK